jgi:hypothetical protein
VLPFGTYSFQKKNFLAFCTAVIYTVGVFDGYQWSMVVVDGHHVWLMPTNSVCMIGGGRRTFAIRN